MCDKSANPTAPRSPRTVTRLRYQLYFAIMATFAPADINDPSVIQLTSVMNALLADYSTVKPNQTPKGNKKNKQNTNGAAATTETDEQ